MSSARYINDDAERINAGFLRSCARNWGGDFVEAACDYLEKNGGMPGDPVDIGPALSKLQVQWEANGGQLHAPEERKVVDIEPARAKKAADGRQQSQELGLVAQIG